jgi:predicted dehydrogenase
MRLLILGTGRMASAHAKAYRTIEGVEVVAGADSDPANLATFCDEFGIDQRFPSLEAALAWGQFDAVDNVTPDAIHHPTTMAALAAGKHVFCEKPLAQSYPLAIEMTEAAEKAGLINMVNLSYRNVAELHEARRIIAAGTIGKVKHIEASYLQHWVALRDFNDPGPWLWRLSTAHGSNGTLGDIGIHILDFTTYAAGVDITSMTCRLQTFNKVPGDRLGEYVLDANDSFIISAEFSNGAIGVIHSSRWASGHSNDQRLRVYGDKGAVELSHGHWGTLLRVCAGEDVANGTWREVRAEPVPTNYHRFVEAVRTGRQAEPSFRHAAGLQRLLDLALVAGRDRQDHLVSQD